MKPLDPYSIPLKGSHLIEASAGTGKTYTLTLLYIRLLLEKQLSVDQILVVTFTRAATDELRSRIRNRLNEVASYINSPDGAIPELDSILAKSPMAQARQLINDALVRMDEATIYTIHGFCQRVLQDNAFESGLPFDMNFIESEQTLRRQIIEDFWRHNFYAASKEKVEWVMSLWSEPLDLLSELTAALSHHKIIVKPEITSRQLDDAKKKAVAQWLHICSLWKKHSSEIETILVEDKCLKRSKSEGYEKNITIPLLLDGMRILCRGEKMVYLLPEKLQMLRQSHINSLLMKKCSVGPEHPFFMEFEQFYTAHQTYTTLVQVTILQDALAYLKDELRLRKQVQSQLYFDDLLTCLAQALTDDTRGKSLAKQIAAQYPAALVDEFQDTDPLQYDIFSSIYNSYGSLFMIGDPKQAIYSFRGADIFTYIRARRQTPLDNIHTMETNYRSTPEMVGAVNKLFNQPNGFLFAPDISFNPVQPNPEQKKYAFAVGHRQASPLNVILLEQSLASGKQKVISKTNAQAAAADACAGEISRLLHQAKRGEVTIGEQKLQAGDIGVLVRTHFEAEAMQKALKRQNITSVYFSRNSVFATKEAQQLLQFLQTLLNLKDTSSCATALASDLFGLDGLTLATGRNDDSTWGNLLEQLQEYRRIWLENGVMVMLQKLFSREKLVQRLTARKDGHRKCTNYLHLAELLHKSNAITDGSTPLVRWLEQQCEDPDPEMENEQLRLENDEELVKIVTIHKSKGLEYPLVFLPFLWYGRMMDAKPPIMFHDATSFSTILDFEAAAPENLNSAAKEFEAEAVRLLYVALTRAKYSVYFCWGQIRDVEHSALSSFLQLSQLPAMAGDGDLISKLEELNYPAVILSVKKYPADYQATYHSEEEEPGSTLKARVFGGTIKAGALFTSYSQLAQQHERQQAGLHPDPLQILTPSTEPEEKSRFSFPKGATAGTCLHAIFEQIDFAAAPETWEMLIEETLTRHAIEPGWTKLSQEWIHEICTTPLPGSCSLSTLDAANRLDELSFLFPLEMLDIEAFNTVLRQHDIEALSTGKQVIEGMMKGFIDLVFSHEDTFYIADYKSNFLGTSFHDYSHSNLIKAMDEHRYDLQYLIYTIAINRFLKSRLKDYHYDHHFGGVYYLFLRGMGRNYPPGNGVFFAKPDQGLIEALDSCCQVS